MTFMPEGSGAEIGFLFAASCITALFNVRWRTYIWYFFKGDLEQAPFKVGAIRVAFAVAFMASVFQLIAAIVANGVANNFFGVLIVAMLMIAAFVCIDLLFRVLTRQ